MKVCDSGLTRCLMRVRCLASHLFDQRHFGWLERVGQPMQTQAYTNYFVYSRFTSCLHGQPDLIVGLPRLRPNNNKKHFFAKQDKQRHRTMITSVSEALLLCLFRFMVERSVFCHCWLPQARNQVLPKESESSKESWLAKEQMCIQSCSLIL